MSRPTPGLHSIFTPRWTRLPKRRSPWTRSRSNRPTNADPSRYALVVVSDVLSLPAPFEQQLQRYVRGGGSVLVAAGTSAAHRPRVPVFDEKILDSRYYASEGQRFLTVGSSDTSYPFVEKAGKWAGVKFYFAVQVDPGNAQVISRLTDQTPIAA